MGELVIKVNVPDWCEDIIKKEIEQEIINKINRLSRINPPDLFGIIKDEKREVKDLLTRA